MLIEAARGGHTSVVNLLLRQPLMKRRQQLDQASAAASDNRKLALSATGRSKHVTMTTTSAPTPVADDSSGSIVNAASSGGCNQTGKTLSSTSTLQHISPPEQSQLVQQDSTTTTVAPGPTGSTGVTGLTSLQQIQQVSTSCAATSGLAGGSSVYLQHHPKVKLVQKSGCKLHQQQAHTAEREAGFYPQQQQLIGDGGIDKGLASSSVMTSSRKGSGGSDLIGAKRPKMSSTEPSSSSVTQPIVTTPTKQPNLVDSDLSYLVTPPATSTTPSVISSTFSPGHYTTDSATALKNMQRLTSNTNSPLKAGVMANEVGANVDVPPLLHSQTHMVNSNSTHVNSNEVPLPLSSTQQLTADSIIQGHITADDIIARYWQQQNISELSSNPHTSSSSSSVMSESKANGSRENTQRLFSSGNFSTLPPHPTSLGQASYLASRYYPTGGTMGGIIPPGEGGGGGDPRSLLVNSLSTGEHTNANSDTTGISDVSNVTQTSNIDSHPLSNVDLTQLIPHLEALVGSLQHQSPLDTHQYLHVAALAAQSGHLLHPLPVSTKDGSISMPQDVGVDGKTLLPGALGSLDPSALFSAAEIAKLLPNIAGYEPQSDGADFRAVARASSSTNPAPTGPPLSQSSQPIYPASLSTLRHLSQQLTGGIPSSEMHPDPGGGIVMGGAMGVAGVGSEEEGSEVDVDLLHHCKFPLDIPPPNELGPPENVSSCIYVYVISINSYVCTYIHSTYMCIHVSNSPELGQSCSHFIIA